MRKALICSKSKESIEFVMNRLTLTTVAKESYVIVVEDGHEPECVTEEAGDEPVVVDDGCKNDWHLLILGSIL